MPIVTRLLMLLTPVLYPPPQSGVAAKIPSLNPLTPLVTTTRDWLTLGTTHISQASSPSRLFMAVILVVAGWVAYQVALPHLVARFGN